MAYEFVVNLKAKDVNLSSKIAKSIAAIERLNEDEIALHVKFYGDVDGYNKIIQQIEKENPNLGVTFQYDANEIALKEEMQRLQGLKDLKLDIDTGRVQEKLKVIRSEIEEAYNIEDDKKFAEKVNHYFQYINAINANGGKLNRGDLADNLKREYEGVDDLLDIIDKASFKNNKTLFDASKSIDQDIAESEKRVSALQKILEKLQNFADKNGYSAGFSELSERVKKLETDVNEFKERIDSLSGEKFQNLSADVEALDTKVADLVSHMKELDAMSNHPEQIAYHVGPDSFKTKGQRGESLNRMISNMNGGGFDEGDVGFGILGTGTYVTKYSEDLATGGHNARGYALDLSKYTNLFKAETDQMASDLIDFLGKLQGFVSVAAGYKNEGWDKHLEGVDTQSLFEQYQSIFDNAKMKYDEFVEFVHKSTDLVKRALDTGIDESGNFNNLPEELDHFDNVATQFMKANGYGGVDMSGTWADSYEHGSVIYDFNPSDIIKEFTNDESRNAFADSVRQKIEEIKNSSASMSGEIADSISQIEQRLGGLEESLANLATRLGQDFGEKYASGIESKAERVAEATENLVSVASKSDDFLSGDSVSANNTDNVSDAPVSEVQISFRPADGSAQKLISDLQAELDATTPLHVKVDGIGDFISDLQDQVTNATFPVYVPARPDLDSAAPFIDSLNDYIAQTGKDVNVGISINDDAAHQIMHGLQDTIDNTEPAIKVDARPDDDSGRTFVSILQDQVNADIAVVVPVDPQLTYSKESYSVQIDAEPYIDSGSDYINKLQQYIDNTDGVKVGVSDVQIQDQARRLQVYNDGVKNLEAAANQVIADIKSQIEKGGEALPLPVKAEKGSAKKIIGEIKEQIKDGEALSLSVKAAKGSASKIAKEVKEQIKAANNSISISVEVAKGSASKVFSAIKKQIKDANLSVPIQVNAYDDAGEKLIKEVNAQTAASASKVAIKIAPDSKSVASFVSAVQKKIDTKSGTVKVSRSPRILSEKQLEKLSAQEGPLKQHQNVVTEIARTEADALNKTTESANKLNAEIKNGVKELTSALTQLRRLEKEGKLGNGIKPRVIDDGIQSRLDIISDGVKSLYSDNWSDDLKIQYLYAAESMDKLVESYKNGTVTMAELKSAANDYTKSLTAQAQAEEKAAEAAKKARDNQAKADDKKAADDRAKTDKANFELAKKYLQDELKLRKEIFDLQNPININKNTTEEGMRLRREQADAMHKSADDLLKTLTMTPEQKAQIEKFQTDLTNFADKATEDLIAKTKAKFAKFGDIIATNIGNSTPEIRAAMEKIVKEAGGKITSPFDVSTGNLTYEWRDQEDDIIQRSTLHYDENTQSIYRNNKAQREAETTLQRVGISFKKISEYIVRYITTYMSLQQIISGVRQGFQYVAELDKALTELQLVTRQSDAEIVQFADDAYKAADAVASTTSAVVSSATEWARLGYTMEDSLALASNSAKLARAGFMEVSEATSELTSSLQAFYGTDIQQGLISAGDAAATISDKMVYIGNNYAITAQGLGEGMQRSAAALVAAGNDINEAIALTTAGNVISQDPNSVSNALKVVSMRLRGTNASGISAELGEEVDIVDTSFSKLYKTIQNLTSVKANDFKGISILTDSGAYKSTYEILLEISEVWDDISDANQAALLEQLAGKTRGAVVAGILQNGEILKKALSDSQNAAGATDKAMEVAMDSIEAKINQMKNTWQKAWQDLIASDTAKAAIDLVGDLAKALDGLIELLNKIPGNSNGLVALLAGGQSVAGRLRHIGSGETTRFQGDLAGAAMGLWNARKNRGNNTSGYGSVLYNGINFAGSFVKDLELAKQKSDELGDSVFDLSGEITSLYIAEGRTVEEAQAATDAIAKGEGGLNGLITASKNAGKSFVGLNGVLSAVVQTLGSMALSVGISLAIQGVAKLFDMYANAASNAIKKAEEFKQSIADQRKEYKENAELVNSLSDRFTALSRGVDENGNNIALTAEEFDEYKRVVKQIVDIYPELGERYDSVNGYIVDQASFIEDAIKVQERYNEELEETLTNSESVRTRINGAGANIAQAQAAVAKEVMRYVDNGDPNRYNDVAFGWNEALKDVYSRTEFAKTGKDLNAWLVDNFGNVLDTSDVNHIIDNNLDVISDLQGEIVSLMEENFKSGIFNGKEAFNDSIERFNKLADATRNYKQAISDANAEVSDVLLGLAKQETNWESLSENQQRYIANLATMAGDAEKLTIEKFWGNTRVEDTEAFQDALKQITNSASVITSTTLTSFEQSIGDISKYLSADEYWEQIDTAIDVMYQKLLSEGITEFETPVDLGLYLQVYAKDEKGNDINNRKQLEDLINSKLEGTYDLSSLSQIQLESMASYARTMGSGETARGLQMLYGGRVNQRTMDLEDTRIKSYSEIETAINGYDDALRVLNDTIIANTELTEEQYQAVASAVGESADLSFAIETITDSVSGEVKYIVRDVDALNDLVSASRDATSTSKNLARNQDAAQKRYYQLVRELNKAVRATDDYNESSRDSIYSIEQQIDDVGRLIDRYAMLEQKLLGTTNAYTRFADAQELDAQNTYADTFSAMIEAFDSAVQTGFYGDYAVQEAIKAIVPESLRNGKTQEEIIGLAYDTIAEYLKLGLVDAEEGKAVIDYDNAKAFFELASGAGVFTGTWENHELSESVSSIDDIIQAIADANNGLTLSEEYIVAIIETMRRAEISGHSWISDLVDSLDDKLLRATENNEKALRDYYNLLANGPDTDGFSFESVDEYDAALREAKANMDATQASLDGIVDSARESIEQIIALEKEAGSLEEQANLADTQEEHDKLLAQRQQLLDQLAQIEQPSQIQLDAVLKDIDEEIEAAEKANGTLFGDLDSNINELKTLRNTISAKWSEDDKEVKDSFQWLIDASVDGVNLEIACNGRDALKQLEEIQKRLEKITVKDKTIDLDISDDYQEKLERLQDRFEEITSREVPVAPNSDDVYQAQLERLTRKSSKMSGVPGTLGNVTGMASSANELSHEITQATGEFISFADQLKAVQHPSVFEDLQTQIEGATQKYRELQETVSRPVVTSEEAAQNLGMDGWWLEKAAANVDEGSINIDVSVEDAEATKALEGMMDTAVDLDSEEYRIHLGLDSNLWNTVSGRLKWLGNTLRDLVTGDYNIRLNASKTGGEGASGNTQVTGTFGNSYANGKANDLVGELGRELVVDPAAGRYYTVGDNGPEMVNLPANAIVFNARQTEDLLSKGRTSTRGNALAEGNAYSGSGTIIMETLPQGQSQLSSPSSPTSSSAAQAEAADWYEAFEKAYNDLKKLRDDDVIDADEYYRRLQALYTDYFNKYGAANEENADKLRDAWKQMYEDEKSDLEDRYNNNEMGTKEYLDRLRNLYQRFYKDIPGFAKEAARAQKEYLNVLKGEYDKLFSAAVSIIGRRISALQDEYNERVEALEKEQEAANKEFERQIKAIDNQIKAYEKQIKAVQKQIKVYEKEIEAIQKANEERQDAIDLQKAQYELARAQNQRTQHVYTSEKGFVYRANPQDIKTAQDNLETKEQEARVKSIQKEIDALQEVVDGYNEKIELLNEEKERIQELQEATNEYYENAIQAVRDYYEPMIKNLEKTQQMWQDFIDAEELAENIGVFKEFGITVDQVLNSTAGDIDIVKGKYAELLAAYYADNPEMLSAWSDVMGTDLANVVTNIDSLGTSLDGFGTHLAGMTQPWGEVMHTLGSVPEELTTVVNQSVNAITASQEPIDHYIQYILQFEDAMREAGVTIGDFWQANGELKAGIDQGAFEMYVTSWNKLNEELGKAPGNIEPTSAALKAIMDSSITREQVDNYSQWLNEMSAHMPGISQSVAAFAGNDLSGVTGNMATMLSDSNVKNALDLGTSLPTVASGITEMSGANLTGALSLSDILSGTNVTNAGALGNSLGDVSANIGDISGVDLNNANSQISGLADNADRMSTLATNISSVATSISGFNVSPEVLANFQQFVNDFVTATTTFKTQVQGIFGASAEGQAGVNASGQEGSTGGEGGSEGNWFAGLLSQIEELNSKTNDWLTEIEGRWTAFKEQLQTIIGKGGAEFGDFEAAGEDTIIGAVLLGGINFGMALGGWLTTLETFLGADGSEGGLTYFCGEIKRTVEEMCEAITTSCNNVTQAISGMSQALGNVHFPEGFTYTSSYQSSSGNVHSGGGHIGGADGTAHVNGTALADGRWGLKRNQRGTLVGELGPETLIRNGQYTIIGATGPERMNLRRGDIILNHRQTEQVFKYGKATGRGKAYASGTVNRDVPGLIHTTMPTGFDKFVSIIKDIGADIKVMKPEVHRIELAVAGAGVGGQNFGSHTQNTIENINVSLPNFNSSKADDLINDLQSLSLQAVQRFNRK